MLTKTKGSYFLIILATLFLACEDKITSSVEESIEEKNFTIIYGDTYDIVNNDTLITGHVNVTVDDSTFMAYNGHYHLEKFEGDSLNIKFETEYHYILDTTLIIGNVDSLEMDIELQPIKLEIYPLYKGNEWKYNIDIEVGDRSGNKYVEKGIEINYLSRVESDEIQRIYYFNHSYKGYKKTNSDSSSFDYKGTYSVIEYLSTSLLIWGEKPTFSITRSNRYLIDGIIDFESSIDEYKYPMQRYLPSSRVKHYGTPEYVNNNSVQVHTLNGIVDKVFFNIGLKNSSTFWSGISSYGNYQKYLISLTSDQ